MTIVPVIVASRKSKSRNTMKLTHRSYWARLGVSYVFYLAALSCVLQLAAAHLVGRKNPSKSVPQ